MKLYEVYSQMENYQHICGEQMAWFCDYADLEDIDDGEVVFREGLVAYEYDNSLFIRTPLDKRWENSRKELDQYHMMFAYSFIGRLS